MQITFTVKDKLIKSAITEILDNEIYGNYDSATIKMAKLPKISAKVNEIFDDAKFQAAMIKHLSKAAESMMEDSIYDELGYEMDITLPGLTEMIEQCDRVSAAVQEQEEINREAEEVKRMVKTLEKAGFKIVKS
jgi:3-methyladenine DNA glycosylase Tag